MTLSHWNMRNAPVNVPTSAASISLVSGTGLHAVILYSTHQR